jgi:hypothetical protein
MIVAAGARPLGMASLTYAMAGVLIAGILVAGWNLGGRALRSDDMERRSLALAGGLLVAAWAVIVIFAAMGPPHLATLTENKIRYPLILTDAIAVAGALLVLREALRGAGERLFSALGSAAISIAAPLYVVFCAVQFGVYRAAERSGPERGAEMTSLDDLSLVLLFVGVILTYLATAAVAAALARTGWMGRTASRVLVGTSLAATACVAARMTEALASAQNPMWGFGHWLTLPGFVLAIPAVPWIMPCLIGIVLLRRAGAEL